MKKINPSTFKVVSIFIILFVFSLNSIAQNFNSKFKPFNSYENRSFIENVGQFENRNWQNNEIQYAYAQNPFYIFFSNNGLTYRFDKIIKNPKYIAGDKTAPKRINISELIHVEWLNCNENVEIVSENITNDYNAYAYRTGNETKSVNEVKGYKKITYKNLYDNIDVEYTIHPKTGVKYNLILYPGADLSQVKLKYSDSKTNVKNENISIQLNNEGQIQINTSLGDVIEHSPVTFYENSNQKIESKYIFENNILTFNLAEYDHTKKVIIDPWIVSPTYTTSTAVWEVETDGVGNIYTIGGETPMQLKKYDAAGALQWTYTTPWDTNSVWLGTMATDANGTTYVTSGTTPEIQRIDNAGNMIWYTTNNGFSVEYWSITFNCDKTKLIVGGTKGVTLLPFLAAATIYDIDVNTGNVLNEVVVDDNSNAGFTPIEVRSISSTKNARYAFLTHNDIGAINQNLGVCPTDEPIFKVDNSQNLAYKCEDYLPETQNGGGLKALVANDNFIYYNAGDKVYQRDINTGVLINTVNLPGGVSNTVFGGGDVVSNSGLAVDDCGSVYAGSNDRVVKYDQNLNFISESLTSFSVYDVSVNSNGEVIAVGAQSDNSATNRNGRMESINMGACAQFALVCCDANVCPVDTVCVTDAAVSLTPNTPGGTWSGNGVDAAGNFDPAVAGVGVHTITYTLACGGDSFDIVVSSCATLTACLEANGDVTASGGTAPFTWESWEVVGQSCDGPVIFGLCTGNLVDDYGWVVFGGNSATETPPNANSQIQISDTGGGTVIIADVSTLAACSTTCDATITAAGPFCTTDASVNLTAVDGGGTWSGIGITDANLGTFDPATAGAGTHTITYALNGGCAGTSDTQDIIVNAVDDATFTYANTSFCLTDPNPTPNSITTAGGTFSIDNGGAINASTGQIDIATSGAGTFVVTYLTGGTCPASSTVTITLTNGSDATITAAGPFCTTDASVNLTAVDGGGTWSGTGITDASLGTFDPATAGVGTHTITYTISGSCGATDTQDIIVNAVDDATFTYANASFCLTDPNPTPNSITTAGGTFSIDNGGTINASTGQIDIATSGAGTYVVTYLTGGTCPASSTVTITLTNGSDASITAAGPFCTTDASVNLTAVDGGGTWSGTGITDANLGTFDPSQANIGNNTITYTIPGSCGATATSTIGVNAVDDANFSYASTTFCNVDSNPLPTSIGTNGGTFTIDNGGVVNSSTGEINLVSSGTGSFTVTYTTNGICPSSSSVTITIAAGGTIVLTQAGPFCETSLSETLISSIPGGTWSGTGITDGTLGIFDPVTAGVGTHTITYTIAGACGGSETIDIVVNPNSNAGISPSVTIEYGTSVDLVATGGGSFAWSPDESLSCNDCADPLASPTETTTYCVTVNNSGCIDTACTVVIVDYNCGDVFVPNAFSPNDDASNNLECVYGSCITQMHFRIYDRWGELVYESSNLNTCWDGTYKGKDLSTQVFVYLLDATLITGEKVSLKGNISLIR